MLNRIKDFFEDHADIMVVILVFVLIIGLVIGVICSIVNKQVNFNEKGKEALTTHQSKCKGNVKFIAVDDDTFYYECDKCREVFTFTDVNIPIEILNSKVYK